MAWYSVLAVGVASAQNGVDEQAAAGMGIGSEVQAAQVAPPDTVVAAPKKDPRAARIDSVYGRRSLLQSQEENYRVWISPKSYWPVSYEWDMGDGTRTVGNNVVHLYRRPGKYRLRVTASNPFGTDTTSFWVNVSDVRQIAADGDVSEDGRSEESAARRESAAAARTVAASDEVGESYFSWVLETHLSRASAEIALRAYVGSALDQVRVFVDDQGPGSVAYRILAGKYATRDRALPTKKRFEEITGRPVTIIAIGS